MPSTSICPSVLAVSFQILAVQVKSGSTLVSSAHNVLKRLIQLDGISAWPIFQISRWWMLVCCLGTRPQWERGEALSPRIDQYSIVKNLDDEFVLIQRGVSVLKLLC